MKRIFVLFLSVVLLLSSATMLISCNDGGEYGFNPKDYSDVTTDPDKEVTLRFGYWADDTEQIMFQDIKKSFEAANPKTKVELVRYTGDYSTQLMLDFANNYAPDVFFMKPGDISPFILENKLMALDYFQKKDNARFKEEDMWKANDAFKYDGQNFGQGHTFGYLKDFSPDFMLYYNKTYLDSKGLTVDNEHPMSWSEFEEFVKSAKGTTTVNGNTLEVSGSVLDFSPYEFLLQLILQNGGKVFSDDNTKILLDDPNTREAIEYFVQLQSGPDAAIPYIAGSKDTCFDKLLQQRTATMFSGRWFYPRAYADSTADGFEIGVALPPMPDGKTDNPVVTSTALIGYSISVDTEYPDRAYQFLDYLMNEGQERLMQSGYNMAGNKTVCLEEYGKVTDPKVKTVNELNIKAANEYTSDVTINPYIKQATYLGILQNKINTVLEGKMSLDQALQEAQSEINNKIQTTIEDYML